MNSRYFFVVSVTARRDLINAEQVEKFFTSVDLKDPQSIEANSRKSQDQSAVQTDQVPSDDRPAVAAPSDKERTATVGANDHDDYSVDRVGGNYVQLRVHSYGSTFLYVGIYDRDGNLLAADNDRNGDALLTFYASYSGAYRIVVLNKAPIANSYHIAID